jgi:hypothetical protein
MRRATCGKRPPAMQPEGVLSPGHLCLPTQVSYSADPPSNGQRPTLPQDKDPNCTDGAPWTSG